MLWPCVCLPVTSRCSIKTAKHRITQTTPHHSPLSLVFGAKDISEIPLELPAAEAPNAGGVG